MKVIIEPGANLRNADLRNANLLGANLRGANLRGAKLNRANLRNACLRDAYLRDANLPAACLREADLRNADLRDAYLCGANLSRADLRGADLRDSYLYEAIGIVRLPVGDPRGYDAFAHEDIDGDWKILSGCRHYNLGSAALHWGSSYEGDREIGDRYLYAIDWLREWLDNNPEK